MFVSASVSSTLSFIFCFLNLFLFSNIYEVKCDFSQFQPPLSSFNIEIVKNTQLTGFVPRLLENNAGLTFINKTIYIHNGGLKNIDGNRVVNNTNNTSRTKQTKKSYRNIETNTAFINRLT